MGTCAGVRRRRSGSAVGRGGARVRGRADVQNPRPRTDERGRRREHPTAPNSAADTPTAGNEPGRGPQQHGGRPEVTNAPASVRPGPTRATSSLVKKPTRPARPRITKNVGPAGSGRPPARDEPRNLDGEVELPAQVRQNRPNPLRAGPQVTAMSAAPRPNVNRAGSRIQSPDVRGRWRRQCEAAGGPADVCGGPRCSTVGGMRAIRLHETGGPEVLRPGGGGPSRTGGGPGPRRGGGRRGELRRHRHALGRHARSGAASGHPGVRGGGHGRRGGSGRRTRRLVGARVTASGQGGYAEYAAVPAPRAPAGPTTTSSCATRSRCPCRGSPHSVSCPRRRRSSGATRCWSRRRRAASARWRCRSPGCSGPAA